MCEKVQKDWTREWNDEQKVPFAHNNFHWVSYEDLESLKIKVNLFILIRFMLNQINEICYFTYKKGEIHH